MKVDNHIASASSMRKLCPNLDREDGLDTVLEVPIPEEMFVGGVSGRNSSKHFGTRCTNVMAWMRSQVDHRSASSVLGRNAELQLMLGVVGAPLVPIPMPSHHSNLSCGIKEDPIVSCSYLAKYLSDHSGSITSSIIYASNTQTFGLQGLDPKSTANLFTSAVCIGEKTINNHDCFVLRLDAEASTLRSRSSSSVEIIRHTLWGYFSQRTALLVHLEDSHLLRIKTPNQESVYWETTMESSINDYRPVDGVQIAHAGRTSVSLFRFGETEEGNTRTRMEETWTVEEVDFNIWGLSMDCFLPPGDIKEEKEGIDEAHARMTGGRPAPAGGNLRIGASQIAAVNIDETME